MKNQIKELIICTIVPTVIPIIWVIPQNHISDTVRTIIVTGCYMVDLVFIVLHYIRKLKGVRSKLGQEIKSTAYTNAYQISEIKRDYIINKSYNADYSISKTDVPYDVHNYIAAICKNFRDTISKITLIPQEHMAVTFIYHYTYSEATPEDESWRWVVGKESSIQTPLNHFVERDNSLYNYIVNGEKGKQINSVFCNDKRELAGKGHYYMSARDKDHNKIGSVFATKVLFGNNAESFVEGILLVSSYGKRFVEGESYYDKTELKTVLFEELYPYYQRLLETELGILYLRHKKV